MAAQLIGRTTIGERVWDVQRVIDVLEKHFPQVDSGNIMCTGGSGGGTATFSQCVTQAEMCAQISSVIKCR